MNYFEMKWRLSACRIQAGYSQAGLIGTPDAEDGGRIQRHFQDV